MIKLEYFVKSDCAQLINWIKDEELLINWSGTLFHFPLTEESMNWYIEDINDLNTSSALVYKVKDTETNTVIGHISLGNISRKNQSARITRVLIGDEENKGKGFCKKMIQAILKIGFEDLHLHRISLGVYDFNASAIKCYQKAGLMIEGNTRECLLVKDKWWSLIEMSILENEWKAM